jgi:hypothetical protein
LGDFKKFTSRAKIGVNLHFYGGQTALEIHRIMHLVTYHVLVLSSRSDDAWLDDLFSPIVTFYDNNDDFVEKFKQLNSLTDKQRGVLAMKRLNALRNMPSFKDNFLSSGSIFLNSSNHWKTQQNS